MVIFLQEDHELPIIDGTARIRGGSRSEPANALTRRLTMTGSPGSGVSEACTWVAG